MKNFFTHWKTSLLGLSGSVLIQAAQGTSWKTIGTSLLVALFGAVSADSSVTTPSVGPMGKMALLLGLMFALPFNVHAQTPDNRASFTFTNTTTNSETPTFDNRQLGCYNWTVAYVNTGFSAVSLVFESTDGANVPGTFVAFSGTTTSGANPATTTTFQFSTFQGYVPWYRVRLDTATGSGTIRGTIYCYKNGVSLASIAKPFVNINGTICMFGVYCDVNYFGVLNVGNYEIITSLYSGAPTSGFNPFLIRNAAVASVGNQRYSPPMTTCGAGWKTNATAASQIVCNRIVLAPTQGTAAPSGDLDFDSNVNNGNFVIGGAKLRASSYTSLGTKFTTDNGCMETTLVGGGSAGRFKLGANGPCTVVVTMGNSSTSPNGWACDADDRTTLTILVQQSADSTTTATFPMPIGALLNDVIGFKCIGY